MFSLFVVLNHVSNNIISCTPIKNIKIQPSFFFLYFNSKRFTQLLKNTSQEERNDKKIYAARMKKIMKDAVQWLLNFAFTGHTKDILDLQHTNSVLH